MQPTMPPSAEHHDEKPIDWFLSLQPEERLAELESRLSFFQSARRDAIEMVLGVV